MQKQTQTKCVHHLLALCNVLRVFISLLSSRLDRSTYAPDESWLIWSCEYPQLEPHVVIKMVQVLGSPVYICGLGKYKIWKRCWLHSYKVLSQRSKSKSVKQSGSKTMFPRGHQYRYVPQFIYLLTFFFFFFFALETRHLKHNVFSSSIFSDFG